MPPAQGNWELRIEGRLMDESSAQSSSGTNKKQKFSTFFKSLIIELDKELYGPDNHLVEWHRTQSTSETDGFQVKRNGDRDVKCTILLVLNHEPPQFKLDARLARILGVHMASKPVIVQHIWQYVKEHNLQDPNQNEWINLDKYLENLIRRPRIKFAEIPGIVTALVQPADPIVINYVVPCNTLDARNTSCYDLEVEVADPAREVMQNILLTQKRASELETLENKISETVETINELRQNREFLLDFGNDPQKFIHKWLLSQSKDLKKMFNVVGNPELERRGEYYSGDWCQEAISRYIFNKTAEKKAEYEKMKM